VIDAKDPICLINTKYSFKKILLIAKQKGKGMSMHGKLGQIWHNSRINSFQQRKRLSKKT
jgi:hypothetical protein